MKDVIISVSKGFGSHILFGVDPISIGVSLG